MTPERTLTDTKAPPKPSLTDALGCTRETRALVLGPGVLQEIGRIFHECFPGFRAVVVADANTMPLAGHAAARILTAAGINCAEPFVFTDPELFAEHGYVEQLEAALRPHTAVPIAVGSGTINDLVKLAAHRTARPSYLSVATAASMDGYTAFGASITYRGAKQTFACPAPRAVIADLDILRRAPPELTAAGYADLLAKVTAGADWLLADALAVDPIDPKAWSLVQGDLQDALADPAGARAGDGHALTRLIEGLMLGGLAMQWSRTSRPASGAEHQFSHLWDMEHHTHEGRTPSHGFKVGVATLAITALYEQLLRHPFDEIDVARAVAAWPGADEAAARTRTLFARDAFADTALVETAAKHATRPELEAMLTRLRSHWPELRARLRAQLLPLSEIRRRLAAVGAPTEPGDIGLTRERLRATYLRAQHIRRRFTVLDLAVRTGVLEPALDRIFGPDGVWPAGTRRPQ